MIIKRSFQNPVKQQYSFKYRSGYISVTSDSCYFQNKIMNSQMKQTNTFTVKYAMFAR